VNEQAVLYALSTLAQTCAAIAAVVATLGLYRAQSARNEQAATEASLRHLLVGSGLDRIAATNWPINDLMTRAERVLADYPVAQNPDNWRLQAALAKLTEYDPNFRRSSRLIVIVGTWDLGAVLLSLVGFTVVPYLTCRWWTSAALTVLALRTVVTTVAMLFEANGSLVKWLERMKLHRFVVWLERKPRP
jgi:hypothetical protein